MDHTFTNILKKCYLHSEIDEIPSCEKEHEMFDFDGNKFYKLWCLMAKLNSFTAKMHFPLKIYFFAMSSTPSISLRAIRLLLRFSILEKKFMLVAKELRSYFAFFWNGNCLNLILSKILATFNDNKFWTLGCYKARFEVSSCIFWNDDS